jgi:site-specific DNA-cytosine methylase
MATRNERFIAAFCTCWELFKDNVPSKMVINAYSKALEAYTIEQIEAAFSNAIGKSSWMPKPVELIEYIAGSPQDVADRAMLQAHLVIDAIRQHGAYKSVKFDDAVTNAVIDQGFGGWVSLAGDLLERNLKWFVKDFIGIYQAYSRQGITKKGHLIGLHEQSAMIHKTQRPEIQLISSKATDQCGGEAFAVVNYYNDNDSFSVKWLKALIAEGLIPKGDVDDRSITEIKPSELDGYTQCHFFAGIGGWPYALRLSGWPEDRPVFTGSCPCQPFSVAGQGKGIEDERHLWPAFRWLIAQKRPATIFGEQVASSDGREWLSGVRLDLETMGYEVGAADLCAAGVGAPHIRQRLFWVADSKHAQRRPSNTAGNQHNRKNTGREKKAGRPTACGAIYNGLGNSQAAGIGKAKAANRTWENITDRKYGNTHHQQRKRGSKT